MKIPKKEPSLEVPVLNCQCVEYNLDLNVNKKTVFRNLDWFLCALFNTNRKKDTYKIGSSLG